MFYLLFSDLFENPTKGIFAYLEQECVMKTPSIENFVEKVIDSSNGTIRHSSIKNSFVIKHFARTVVYCSVDKKS